MFEVTIIKSFSAAHRVDAVKGDSEKLHGHNFKVEVTVAARSLTQNGLLIDFSDLKKHVNEILDKMDHRLLNDLDCFAGRNPSAEIIAQQIGREIAGKFKDAPVKLSKVKVWESPDASASYIPEDIIDS
jgi:6-pyruvoyltetrahydropterin/6-carboxytetrahydropterin synthase